MSKRFAACAVLLACAFALEGQQNMFKIELEGKGTSATAVSLDEPKLVGDTYVFQAWPDGASVKVPKAFVKKITRLTGKLPDTVYQIDLNPTGFVLARDLPVIKDGVFVFHTWRAGTLTSARKADVRLITQLTGDQAFWAEQRQTGMGVEGNLAMQGTGQVISIGTPPDGGSSQAGRTSASSLQGNPGISGAPQGNWLYQGTPGVSDAYAPANATMSNGVPTMPAATSGSNPPQ
jgi:hypothetical protein